MCAAVNYKRKFKLVGKIVNSPIFRDQLRMRYSESYGVSGIFPNPPFLNLVVVGLHDATLGISNILNTFSYSIEDLGERKGVERGEACFVF